MVAMVRKFFLAPVWNSGNAAVGPMPESGERWSTTKL